MKKHNLKMAIFVIIGCMLPNIVLAESQTPQIPDCATHHPCPANQVCECGITPSAYDRYFYFDFSALENKNHYTCTFDNKPSTLTIDIGRSIFPAGSHYECTGSCPHFGPGATANILLDTTKVSTDKSTMIIRYFVPTGDIPNFLRVVCKKDNWFKFK